MIASRRVLVLAAAVVLLPGCSVGDDETASTVTTTVTSTVTTEAPSSDWPGPPRASERGAVPVDAFNRHLRSEPGGASRSPVLVAAEFLGPRGEASTTTLTARGQVEGSRRVLVRIARAGLLDDSVEAIRYTLALIRRPNERWEVLSARFSQRCHQGRGHRSFSPKLCL